MKTGCLWVCLMFIWMGFAQEECPQVEPRGIADELTDSFPKNLATPEQREAVIDRIRIEVSGYYYDVELLKNQKGRFDELEQTALAAESEHDFYNTIREWAISWDDSLTTFTSAKEVDAQQAFNNQPFAGIGALMSGFNNLDDGVTITGIRPDGPAKAARLNVGDRILQVDGNACFTINNVRGQENTNVTLLVQSPGEAARELSLTRKFFERFIPTESVAYRLVNQPDIGYFFVGEIGFEALHETKHQLLARLLQNDLASQPDEVHGFILDLRNIDGGDIGGLNDLLGYFVTGSPYMFINGLGNQNFQYVIKQDTVLQDVPLAVLVNQHTGYIIVWATAVLQQRPNTVIIGQSTQVFERSFQYGELPDGSAITVPTATFALKNPDGKLSSEGVRLVDGRVTPDVLIEEDWHDFKRENDPYIKVALEELAKLTD